MKLSYITQVVGSGILAASLTVMPLIPAQAQTDTAPNTSNNPNTVTTQQSDRDFDWGWLGLLGLVGLAGLTRRQHSEPKVYRDPVETTRTTDNY